MIDHERVGRASARLLELRRTNEVVADLDPACRPRSLDEAYATQELVVDGLLSDGAERIGYKVACTSEIAQHALRIDRPLFGQLMSHTTSSSGATLAADRFVHRVIEAEFGFRLGSDVPLVEGGHTHESIADHIDAVIPAIEVVDYRYESWAVGALPIAADDAIHGWWVRGEPDPEWRRFDLATAPVTVYRNGVVVTTGSGAAVLGHPLTVMAWLADDLPRFGRTLRAGDLVTTGVTTDVFEADPGDHVVADFDDIGRVEVRFD